MVIEVKREAPQKSTAAKQSRTSRSASANESAPVDTIVAPNVMIDLQLPESGTVGFRIVGTLSSDGAHDIKSISYTAPPKDRAEYMRDYQRQYMYDRRRAKKEGMTVAEWRKKHGKH